MNKYTEWLINLPDGVDFEQEPTTPAKLFNLPEKNVGKAIYFRTTKPVTAQELFGPCFKVDDSYFETPE